MIQIEPPLRDPNEHEGTDRRRPLKKAMEEYTLSEVQEYCEDWEECPHGPDCAFYGICTIYPNEWRFPAAPGRRGERHG